MRQFVLPKLHTATKPLNASFTATRGHLLLLASGGVHPGGRHAKHHPHRADLAAEEPPELVRICGMCGQRQLRGTDEKGVCGCWLHTVIPGGWFASALASFVVSLGWAALLHARIL